VGGGGEPPPRGRVDDHLHDEPLVPDERSMVGPLALARSTPDHGDGPAVVTREPSTWNIGNPSAR